MNHEPSASMTPNDASSAHAIQGPTEAEAFGTGLRMAFQPIIDVRGGVPVAYEALVRGPDGESADTILAEVTGRTARDFEQKCCEAAIRTALQLDLQLPISLNFLPDQRDAPEACLEHTLWAADKHELSPERLIFEYTESAAENEPVLTTIAFETYRTHGFRTAIDDFAATDTSFAFLTTLRPNFVKLEMELIRGVDRSQDQQDRISRTVARCADLGIDVVAKGIESVVELHCLRDLDITLMQGFLLARPWMGDTFCADLHRTQSRAA